MLLLAICTITTCKTHTLWNPSQWEPSHASAFVLCNSFMLRIRYRKTILHPSQTAESRSISLPALLPKAQQNGLLAWKHPHEMEPHELSVLHLLFLKCFLVVANGNAEHDKDSTHFRHKGSIRILNPFPSPHHSWAHWRFCVNALLRTDAFFQWIISSAASCFYEPWNKTLSQVSCFGP